MKLKFLLLFSVWILPCTALHCLVTRPGFGLVSERCPEGSVGCRIKIDHHAIQYYEYSALYDRNQLVCVFKNEYGPMKSSGCVQRKEGKVRCWCVGEDDCNNPEKAKHLYNEFKAGKNPFEDLIHKKREPKPRNHPISTTTLKPSTTRRPTTKVSTTTSTTSETIFISTLDPKNFNLNFKKDVKTTLPPFVFPTSEVKVIHVNSKMAYNNFIGSPEFKKALGVDQEEYDEDDITEEPYGNEAMAVLPTEDIYTPQLHYQLRDIDDLMENGECSLTPPLFLAVLIVLTLLNL